MQTQIKPLLERRSETPEESLCWDKLTLAQKFSASSLGKFGYEITFVRNKGGHSLAVMQCRSSVAAISEDGDIDTSPKITIR